MASVPLTSRGAEALAADVMKRRMQNVMAGRRIALSSDEFPLLAPADLAALPMPVMLMSGRGTAPIFKAIFSGITRTMPRARAELVEGAGHSVAGDQPARFIELVLDFLRGLD